MPAAALPQARPVLVDESAFRINPSAPTACRTLLVPSLAIMSPLVVVGDSASNAGVFVVWPVPPRFRGRVPAVPPSIGKPVALVRVAALGVPRFGVTSAGLLESTFEPLPVELVTPVPPFATGNVPVTSVV